MSRAPNGLPGYLCDACGSVATGEPPDWLHIVLAVGEEEDCRDYCVACRDRVWDALEEVKS